MTVTINPLTDPPSSVTRAIFRPAKPDSFWRKRMNFTSGANGKRHQATSRSQPTNSARQSAGKDKCMGEKLWDFPELVDTDNCAWRKAPMKRADIEYAQSRTRRSSSPRRARSPPRSRGRAAAAQTPAGPCAPRQVWRRAGRWPPDCRHERDVSGDGGEFAAAPQEQLVFEPALEDALCGLDVAILVGIGAADGPGLKAEMRAEGHLIGVEPAAALAAPELMRGRRTLVGLGNRDTLPAKTMAGVA